MFAVNRPSSNKQASKPTKQSFLPSGSGTRRPRQLALGLPIVAAIFLLLTLPACKHKEASSNENSAAIPTNPPANSQPAAPPNSNAAPAPAQPEPPATPQPIIVAAGTPLTVRLADELGSKISQAGQTFSATLDKDVIVEGQTAIPANSNVTGLVVTARPAGHLAGEATLVLRLTSVNINNVDQQVVTSARSFGSKIKAKGKVKKFFGGLAKRAEGDEREVDLAAQSAYTFTLKQALEIQ
jgi:pyruvate/2-oxoglutarate dehydrogenase complex dihydrolipoamide acyltransferase (E2) component